MTDIVKGPITVPDEAPMLFAENIQLRFENERLRKALEDVLSWAEGVAGDTMDMEAREIEIASVDRALALLGKGNVEV